MQIYRVAALNYYKAFSFITERQLQELKILFYVSDWSRGHGQVVPQEV